MRRLWLVLVMEGRRLRFAPEVYPTQLRAEREAYRWGWFLAGGDESKIQVVDEHHWRVGRTRIRLVSAQVREIPLAAELWVGVCWGPDGQVAATGVLLDKYKAMAWLRSIPSDPNIKPGTKDHTMYLSRTVKRYDGELTGLAYKRRWPLPSTQRSPSPCLRFPKRSTTRLTSWRHSVMSSIRPFEPNPV